MSNSEAIEKIKSTNWELFSQPDDNTSTSVADALIALCQTNDAASSSSAYNKFLYAVGNNHAGTYYPVLLETLPVLEEILVSNNIWPARAVLSVLDDLFASFHPEPGFETILDSSGKSLSIEAAFTKSVINLQPLIERFVADSNPNARIANSLLQLIREHVT